MTINSKATPEGVAHPLSKSFFKIGEILIMTNFNCPNCNQNLIVSSGNKEQAEGSAGSEQLISGFKYGQPIGVGCLQDNCGGSLVVKEGKWGAFIGCSQYEKPAACTGKLSLPCHECSDGQLTVKRNREGTSLFLGCNRYQEINCRGTLSLSDAIVKANNYLRAKEETGGLATQSPHASPQGEAKVEPAQGSQGWKDTRKPLDKRELEEIPF